MNNMKTIEQNYSGFMKFFILVVPLLFIMHLNIILGVQNEMLIKIFSMSERTPIYYQFATELGILFTFVIFFKDWQSKGKISKMSIFYFIVALISLFVSNMLYFSSGL